MGGFAMEPVADGGHVPTAATPPGKFFSKLCARPKAECAVLRKILSKGNPKGCGAARRLRRMQQGGAGAAVAERERLPKARSGMREPQPVKHEPQAPPWANVALFAP